MFCSSLGCLLKWETHSLILKDKWPWRLCAGGLFTMSSGQRGWPLLILTSLRVTDPRFLILMLQNKPELMLNEQTCGLHLSGAKTLALLIKTSHNYVLCELGWSACSPVTGVFRGGFSCLLFSKKLMFSNCTNVYCREKSHEISFRSTYSQMLKSHIWLW